MERITGTPRLDMKRLQIPGTFIEVVCPQCKGGAKIELIDQIYYPGDPFEDHSVTFECEKCDIGIKRKIGIVSVIITMDVHEPKLI